MHNKLKTKLTPSLRFPEFSGEWEQKRLGEIVRISKGSGISKSDITSEGQYPCIRYGELYTRYSEVITEVFSKTNLRDKSSVISGENDLLIPSSGETALDIARTSHVVPKNVLLGGDMTILSLEKNDSGFFFAYYLSNGKKKEIAKLAQGNSVVHIYGSHLKTLEITRPSTEEQQRIASFLTSLDEWIENLKKQKAAQEKYKKGMMQKIFFQEIRFQNDEGKEYPEWEQKRLGEIATITTGSSNREDSKTIGQYMFFDRSNDVRKSDKFLFDDESIVVAGEGLTFKPRFFIGKFDLHQRAYAILKEGSSISWNYLYWFITENNFWFRKMAVGTTMPSLRMDAFNNMIISIPFQEEQQKIADFLSSIDDLISLTNQRITQAEKWKKGVMQRIFI